MVTQTAPAGRKPNVEYRGVEYREALPETRQEATGEAAVPPLTKGSLARIVAQLLSVYDWLSGTPMTQQDRRVREIEESDRIGKAVLLLFVN